MKNREQIKLRIKQIVKEEIQSLTESEKTWTLSDAQSRSLSNLLGRVGASLEDVTEPQLNEKAEPLDYSKMSSSDIEAKTSVVAIDRSIIDGIQEFIDLGIEAKDWYNEMNNKIMTALGESDGCLFLILMAIFSPRNTLSQNFRLAAQTYTGLKKDLENPELKSLFENLLEETNTYTAIRGLQGVNTNALATAITNHRNYLNLNTVKGIIGGAKSINTYLPNLVRIFKLYKSRGYSFTKSDVINEMSKQLTKQGTLGKNPLISAEKVFSFTLNLLAPKYEFESGWMPVTIDTWMASFFYPHLNTKEKQKMLGRSANYMYLAKLTQEQAAKYGMKPQELQAVLWVAMIKKAKGKGYATTFDDAIQKNLIRLKVGKEEMENVDNFFSKVISVVGGG